jgi:hypothetical protein
MAPGGGDVFNRVDGDDSVVTPSRPPSSSLPERTPSTTAKIPPHPRLHHVGVACAAPSPPSTTPSRPDLHQQHRRALDSITRACLQVLISEGEDEDGGDGCQGGADGMSGDARRRHVLSTLSREAAVAAAARFSSLIPS